MTTNNRLKLAFLVFIACMGTVFAQGNSKFTVVLDAGHGSQDTGASYHGFKEKDVTLSVVLKTGKLLEKEGVKVIYTRKTDVFIELDERCNIANKAEADLFVSIHCNSETKKTASGAETYVMGTAKNASHLEVAKKENSVINFESDKTRYEGFDPNKPETIIGLTLLNEQSAFQSIDLAIKIQDGFRKSLRRKDRGVKQAPFWVLHRTAMPSILIELGFISYKPEGEYLTSDAGQDEIAEAITKSIMDYKKEYFIAGDVSYTETRNDDTPKSAPKAVSVPKSVEAPKMISAPKKGESFKIQIATGGKDLALKPSNFKGLKNVTKDKSASTIRYFYGETTDREKAGKLLAEAKAKGYKDAFIVAF
ncbi:N-acetylmuramoyl-L-alanine amidase [Flavobacterium album]|uniref:N-acetylmuramoyl-L-alanine amidase n=1 Tax=Flavobacterium album TaxID=2175091 RepID=A0A2S1R338_9FLAO|nr:N-acetylmuramoyl-L-alanine amidase [Flavobacterium album]AWH86989.1 N-acetylmuramoyl-L-alanine amidase [Flavobacterium album]